MKLLPILLLLGNSVSAATLSTVLYDGTTHATIPTNLFVLNMTNGSQTVTGLESTVTITNSGRADIGGALRVVGSITGLVDTVVGGSLSITGGLSFTTRLLTGSGPFATNYAINAKNGDSYINGFTNVFITMVTNTTAGRPDSWSMMVTNASGADHPIGFGSLTNRFRFSGPGGTNPPSNITNLTALLLAGRSDGSNTWIGYTYFAFP